MSKTVLLSKRDCAPFIVLAAIVITPRSSKLCYSLIPRGGIAKVWFESTKTPSRLTSE